MKRKKSDATSMELKRKRDVEEAKKTSSAPSCNPSKPLTLQAHQPQGDNSSGTMDNDDAQVPRDRDYIDADNDQGEERMEAACKKFAYLSESGSL